MSGILTSWYSRVWGFIGFKICLISFCFKCWITEYFIFLFSLKTCSMSKHIIVSPLMFPVIEMLWFFCCCQELHHLACCLWPVKDKPVEALCLREKKKTLQQNNTRGALVPTLHFDCLISRDCGLLVLASPAFTNCSGKASPYWTEGRWRRVEVEVGWKLFILETNNLKEGLFLPLETVT